MIIRDVVVSTVAQNDSPIILVRFVFRADEQITDIIEVEGWPRRTRQMIKDYITLGTIRKLA